MKFQEAALEMAAFKHLIRSVFNRAMRGNELEEIGNDVLTDTAVEM